MEFFASFNEGKVSITDTFKLTFTWHVHFPSHELLFEIRTITMDSPWQAELGFNDIYFLVAIFPANFSLLFPVHYFIQFILNFFDLHHILCYLNMIPKLSHLAFPNLQLQKITTLQLLFAQRKTLLKTKL